MSCEFASRPIWLILVIVTASLLAVRTAPAAVDAASVQRAIDRGVAYLRKTQNERGGWQEYSGQSCGLSALCTLALLNSGVEKDDLHLEMLDRPV